MLSLPSRFRGEEIRSPFRIADQNLWKIGSIPIQSGVRRFSLFLLFGLLLSLPASAAPAAPAADAGRERPAPQERAIAITVRSAALAEVLTRAAAATKVSLTAAAPAGDQRITLHAGRVTVGELQGALRDLLRLRVSRRGAEAEERYTLSPEPDLAAGAEAWRLRQADALLQGVIRTSSAFAAGRATETVRAMRDRFRRDHPAFPEETLDALDAGYLRQSLLLTPLTLTMRGQLTRSGWVSLPFGWLPPADQTLLATFGQTGAGRATLSDAFSQDAWLGPRVQYRLLYGDRWTDRMLLAQVGAPEAWSSAMLPFILFRQKDDAALYPQAAERADDPEVWRRLPPRFEVAGKSWDAVLVDLAKTMQIKLAADAYARPWLFNNDLPLPEIAGIPLRDALDRLCQQHGYFWWKQNGWYFLRSRTWVEESRVAVPDRLLRGWLASIRAEGALTGQDLMEMMTLSEEQLLTLQIQAREPGEVEFLGTGFNPDQAALLASSFLLYRGFPPAQREVATSDRLPALWLPPAQQNLFAAVAAHYRMPLLPDEADTWSFRFRQEFAPPDAEAVQPGTRRPPRVSGRLTAEWRFGPEQAVRASLALSDRILQTVESANPPEAR